MSGDNSNRHTEAVLALSQRWRAFDNDLDGALAAVVETAAEALDVARASIWLYNDARDAMELRAQHGGVKAATLRYQDCPDYFDALAEEEVIVAGDIMNDPRTMSLADHYAKPLGIGALLDAPILVAGEVIGVLCSEALGGPREFSAEDKYTASYLASLASLAFESTRREVSEQTSAEAMALLRAAFEASDAGMLGGDLAGCVTAYNQRFLELWQMPESLVSPAADRRTRLQHIALQCTEPETAMERFEAILSVPSGSSNDVIELKNGTCIECVSQPQMLDGRIIGRVWSFRDVTYQQELERELRDLASNDALTGLYNRRHAEETLRAEAQRARRTKNPLSIVLIDIDHFKKVNDTHGHGVGDEVLKALGDDLRERLRGTDMACRWGGEEFMLILPNTDAAGAALMMEKLCEYIARPRKDIPDITISAGIAQYDGDENVDPTLEVADQNLYAAKDGGRNQVKTSGD